MEEEITFGVWLRKQRRGLDLSRQTFANQVGCAEVTLRRIEAGSLKPSRELASLLLEKLGISEIELPQWISFARGLSRLPQQSIPISNKPITNLPAPLTTFIGREKEQSDVIGLITKHRLVTLTGSGGVGKTRLSLKVGEQVLGDYPDGVWLVELAPIPDPLLVPRTTAIAIGLRDEPQRPVIDMLCDYLRKKRMLIILDNCEHLVAACAHLADKVLHAASNVHILASSREPLGITGEALYWVPSLRLPDIEQALDAFREFDSVTLFEERAQLAQFDFSLTLENTSSVAQICYRVDGIPLAIELAAAKVGLMSTEQIAKQLDENFNLLAGGSRTDLPHHQTLRASVNWSWGLLIEPEKVLMQQLSVFAGGWTLEAAQTICVGEVLELINSLVKKSLIVMHQEASRGTRYRLHETIRQYANEKLVESGESNAIRDRHLKYFLNLAETAEPHLTRPEQLEWLARLDNDYENLRSALQWAVDKITPEYSLRLCAALGKFWEIRFYLREGLKWLEFALAKPSQNPSRIEKAARVRALYRNAGLADQSDDLKRMMTSAELSLKLAQEGQNQQDIAIAKFYMGLTMMRRGDADQAIILMEQSLTEFQELNDPYWQADSYRWLSSLLFLQGNLKMSERNVQYLALARNAGDRLLLANSLISYSAELFSSERVDEAIKCAEEADSLFKQMGQSSNDSLMPLSEIAWWKGDVERARQLLMEIEEILDIQGDKYRRSDVIAHLGLLAMEVGNLNDAEGYFELALTTARELEARILISWRLAELANIHCLRNNVELYKNTVRESIILAKGIMDGWKINPLILIIKSMYLKDSNISAHMLGAIDAFFQKVGYYFFDPLPFEHYYNTAESHARKVLGNESFELAFAEGQKMSLDEALDLALKTVEEM